MINLRPILQINGILLAILAAAMLLPAMIGFLLPKARVQSADEADALAIAICHANHRQARARLAVVSRL